VVRQETGRNPSALRTAAADDSLGTTTPADPVA
jgi:hypothetical protein